MRKLKLQMQISVDGFVAGTDGGLDWMTWTMDDKLMQRINAITDSSDTILLGRKMTDGFVSHWEGALSANPDTPFARKMVEIPKVVFTKTLDTVAGKNISLAKGTLADEIAKLKKQNGRDIVVYGGAGFVSSLLAGGHIDELNLFIHPVMVHAGMKIFDLLNKRQKLSLLSSTAYDNGVVGLSYKLSHD